MPWEVSVDLLYTVNHLVVTEGDYGGSNLGPTDMPAQVMAGLHGRVFHFDYKRADEEIAATRQKMSTALSTSDEVFCARFEASSLLAADTDGADADAEMERARRSADEAVGLRTRPLPPAPKEKTRVAVESKFSPSPVCRYAGQRCEGCDGLFFYGEKIAVGFCAMIHTRELCREAAEVKHRGKLVGTQISEEPSEVVIESSVKNARLATLTDGERLDAARKCLRGKCSEHQECKVMCLRGCGRGVHLVSCLHTSKNYAAAGRLICLDCRLDEILETGSRQAAPASLVQQVTLAMVAELTTGAVSTAAGRNQFVTLERRWATETQGVGGGASGVTLRMPRHNIESFAAFMWWLITDAELARSFGTIMRTAGAVMTMLELTDWTKTPRIKALMRDIEKRCGVESEPCTQTTRRIVDLMVSDTIPLVCSRGVHEKLNEILTSRTLMLLVMEVLAGLRVGEATSSGDLHGIEANNLSFVTPALGMAWAHEPKSYSTAIDDLGQTVEVVVNDSKTGPGRHAAFTAVTRGPCALKAGQIVRRWLKASGIEMRKVTRGGYKVETPNYFVARFNFAGLSQEKINTVLLSTTNGEYTGIAEQAPAIKKYIKERHMSVTLPAEMRYVNVAGGVKYTDGQFGMRLVEAKKWAGSLGMSDRMHIVPGPLIRSTLGTRLTHMPLATKSTYTHLIAAMKEAHERSSKMDKPDVEFDLQGLKVPKFGNHSLRRHSDKVAREALPKHKASGDESVTKRVIDYFFGWLLKDMRKDMQLHYAGMDLFARRVLARVTMYF